MLINCVTYVTVPFKIRKKIFSQENCKLLKDKIGNLFISVYTAASFEVP